MAGCYSIPRNYVAGAADSSVIQAGNHVKFRNTLLLSLFIMTGAVMAQAKERNIEIRTSIDSKYLFCEVKTNGVPGYDNRASALRGEITASESR